MGIIKELPRLIAVQSENCVPLYRSYINKQKEPSKIKSVKTLAEGIAIAKPVRGTQILTAVRETNGEIIAVTENEITSSLFNMMKQGYYIEPTSAAVIAGVVNFQKKNKGSIEEKVIVSVFTGHGLKGTDKLLKLMEGKK